MIDIAKDMQCTQYKLHGLQNKYKKCIILLLHVPCRRVFFGIYVVYILLHLPPLRFHCVGG